LPFFNDGQAFVIYLLCIWPATLAALRIRYVEVATPSPSRIRRIVAVCNWQRLQVCGGDSSAAAVANTSQIFHLARRLFMS